ncbi:MAG TPA: ADP-ribosyl-[dinitrogen reductase] hydrolase [Gammaproteobacteria bacterium]
MHDIEQRAIAAYLGLASGDALGATVEFMTPREIRSEYGVHRDIIGGGWLGLKPGQVTDDTTMSLALGEAILAARTIEPHAMGAAFDAWMRAKPVDIGNTVRRGILNFRNNGTTSVAPNDHDAGNGACMRVLPVALATFGQSTEQIASAVALQAHLTHNNPLSDAGTLCVVQLIQMALAGASKVELLFGPVRALTQRHPEFLFRQRNADNPSGYIVHTLRAVFQAFFDTDTFEECLIDVVNRGGDADTTGAIVGMIGGAYYGLDAIPARWLKGLDKQSADRCREQARALLLLANQGS